MHQLEAPTYTAATRFVTFNLSVSTTYNILETCRDAVHHLDLTVVSYICSDQPPLLQKQ